jgi:hypothetical protein
MAIIETDANGNDRYVKDPDGNEIGRLGKRTAGILLVIITSFAMMGIIAHWPDKLPPVNQDADTKYYYKWFAVTYAGPGGLRTETDAIGTGKKPFLTKEETIAKAKADSAAKAKADSIAKLPDSLKPKAAASQDSGNNPAPKDGTTGRAAVNPGTKCTIDLNTLILLLVALAGFLGNMIHIAASFTNFVGAGKFKRSWILWYCVKPFTAAALAVGVYIIFRAGFLNSGEAVASVNLYGVVALAVLAGLYTDMATQKLKEVFAVIFQSSTHRPDPLSYPPVKITDTVPNPLPLNKAMQLVVTGEGFANRKFTVKINGEEIKDVAIKPNALVFNYDAKADKPELILYDERSVEVLKYKIATSGSPTPTPAPASPTVSAISAAPLTANTAATVTVTGTNLKAEGTKVAITDPSGTSTPVADATLAKTDTAITFKYTPAVAGSYTVTVADGAGTVLKQQAVTVV